MGEGSLGIIFVEHVLFQHPISELSLTVRLWAMSGVPSMDGCQGGPPTSEVHWSLQRSLNAGDSTFSFSRKRKRVPTKASVRIMEQVRTLIFVSKATVIRLSSLLWDGGMSEMNFLR